MNDDVVIGTGQEETSGQELLETQDETFVASSEESPVERDLSKIESYDLHIRVPQELRERLRKTAKIAHGLGLIEEPELRLLMALFIDYGMNILRAKWLKKMGY